MEGIKLRFGKNRRCLAGVALLLTLLIAPAQKGVARTPLIDRSVLWHEDDMRDIPKPRERDPSIVWDMVDDSIVRPFGRLTHPGRIIRRIGTLFGGDPVPPADNVNSLDEVPNSAWFTNRIGLFPLTPEDVARGSGTGAGPSIEAPWIVISAKTAGVTPGFIIRDARDEAYLIKFDPPDYPNIATAAGVISNRLFHAAGYNVPDDAIVTFRRADLQLGTNVKLTLPDGKKRLMREEDLDAILQPTEPSPHGKYRAISSKFVRGEPIGCFNYNGRRNDDPNDRISHENRRELRGLRIMCAWINHFDTKQHNSLDVYTTENGRRFVRHYLIDFASTLGTGAYGPFPRPGFEYTFDPSAILGRMLTVGFREDPWRRVELPKGLPEIGYIESEEFDPLDWRPIQPNTAFANLTDRDGYWAAKIISAFSDEHLVSIAGQAHYHNPKAAAYIAKTLGERRDKIARLFFDRVPPLDFFVLRDGCLVFHDLGEERGLYPGTRPLYRARLSAVDQDRSSYGWTDWVELDAPSLSLNSTEAREVADDTNTERYPFLGIDCQVNRGSGWSSSVTIYVSRHSGRIVAVDR